MQQHADWMLRIAVFHLRIERIFQQIEQHLLYLLRVGQHVRLKIAAVVGPADMGVRVGRAEQRYCLLDGAGQRKGRAVRGTFLRHRADVTDDGARAFALRGDFLRAVEQGRRVEPAGRDAAHHSAREIADGRQRLVQFVRDGAGHFAQDRQACRVVERGLALARLFFQRALLVLGRAQLLRAPADQVFHAHRVHGPGNK